MKYLILLFVLFTFSTNINQKPIVASYGIESNLIKLLYNIYWNSSNNQYYGTKSFIPTNNIEYNFDPIKATNYFHYTDRPTLTIRIDPH